MRGWLLTALCGPSNGRAGLHTGNESCMNLHFSVSQIGVVWLLEHLLSDNVCIWIVLWQFFYDPAWVHKGQGLIFYQHFLVAEQFLCLKVKVHAINQPLVELVLVGIVHIHEGCHFITAEHEIAGALEGRHQCVRPWLEQLSGTQSDNLLHTASKIAWRQCSYPTSL